MGNFATTKDQHYDSLKGELDLHTSENMNLSQLDSNLDNFQRGQPNLYKHRNSASHKNLPRLVEIPYHRRPSP